MQIANMPAATRSRSITQQDVWQAADALLLAGQRPTIERIRLHLGRGSPNTVSPHLDAWFAGLGARLQDPQAFAAPANLPEPVNQAARYLWDAAQAEARANVAASFASREAALQQAREVLEGERAVLAQGTPSLKPDWKPPTAPGRVGPRSRRRPANARPAPRRSCWHNEASNDALRATLARSHERT
ncbi:DNA-binding protein [Cupriavidus basilensis]